MEGVEGGSGGREWKREWREEESKLIQASMCILSKISGGDSGGVGGGGNYKEVEEGGFSGTVPSDITQC